MSALTRAIRAAGADGRAALAPFLTAGFPSRTRFGELLAAVAREADLIEIGLPFSDPVADGVTIQRASAAALADGVCLEWLLDSVREAAPPLPVVLMSYLNPLLAFGLERLGPAAAESGIAGLIVPDLPHEEAHALAATLAAAGLDLVQLVTPVTPPARSARICAESRGFVYAVTRTGTTGGRAPGASAMHAYLDRLRGSSALPVLAGFGLGDPDELGRLAPHVDGAIVGSALVEVLERGADPAAWLRELRSALVRPAPRHA